MNDVAKAIMSTGLGMIFGRILGLLRESLIASTFGIGSQMDNWVITLVLVGVPSSIFMNAIQTALISSLSRNSDFLVKKQLLSIALTTTLMLIGTSGVILLTKGGWLLEVVYDKTNKSTQDQSSRLILWLFPYYLFSSINLLYYGVLQAEKRFNLNAVIPSISSIVVVAVVFIAPLNMDIFVLASAVSIGGVLEFIVLACTLNHLGFNPVKFGNFKFLSESRGMMANALWLVPGTLILSAMPVIEQSIASQLGEGANAALAYGQRVPTALNGLASAALGMAVLPFFSAAIENNGQSALNRMLAQQTRWLLMLGITASLLLAFTSPWIVKLFYERGAFEAQASATVSSIQMAYFFQLPGMVVGMLYTRAAVAQGRTKMLTLLTILTVAMQGSLAWFFSSRFGLSGLGYAAAMTSALNAVFLIMIVSVSLSDTQKFRKPG